MKKIIITLFFGVVHFFVFSQDTTAMAKWGYKGYSGGMFVHVGYVQSGIFKAFDLQGNAIDVQIKGTTLGLGGKMSIYLNHYFRVGAEGYLTTCKYGTNENSCRMGWGGITFDMLYPVKKWAPFIGITLGGGSATNLIFVEKTKYGDGDMAIPALYYKQPLSIINPAIGVEFFVSNRISLLFKMDYMLNIYKNNNSYPHGPRFYIGVHFYQKK